jgi:glutaredoxin 3
VKRSHRISFLIVAISVFLSAAVSSGAEQSGLQGEPKRSYGSVDVILYQTSWCPHCTKAREFLKNAGVSLAIYDIEKDTEKQKEMMAKSGSRGVPVVDIEGIIIRGNSPRKMRSAIERKRRE